jgi:hypothetical protein
MLEENLRKDFVGKSIAEKEKVFLIAQAALTKMLTSRASNTNTRTNCCKRYKIVQTTNLNQLSSEFRLLSNKKTTFSFSRKLFLLKFVFLHSKYKNPLRRWANKKLIVLRLILLETH